MQGLARCRGNRSVTGPSWVYTTKVQCPQGRFPTSPRRVHEYEGRAPAVASVEAVTENVTSIRSTGDGYQIPKHWQDQMQSAPMGRKRVLQRYIKEVARVNALEPYMKALTDEQLRSKTEEFKGRLEWGETVDSLLPEAFAVVRETAWRVLGIRHFDCQLVGGMVLHEGQIAEMQTGEGKTLMATLPVYLNALVGRGVHVVTVNDYLAARDAEWMGKIYTFLGLTVAAVQSNMSTDKLKAAYRCDITYVTGQELCFNYLRDNTAQSASELALPEQLHYAVVDEVDSILIDESRNPMIISSAVQENESLVFTADKVVRKLWSRIQEEATAAIQATPDPNEKAIMDRVKQKYLVIDAKMRNLSLTQQGLYTVFGMAIDEGIEFVKAKAEQRTADIVDLWEDTVPWGQLILTSLRAYEFFKNGEQYIVKNEEVIIIDESTGRVRPMSRYQQGVHQAIEAKEEVPVKPETHATASITFQVFFRFYKKLAGMTGTAQTAAAEFYEIYKLKVVPIPTNRPNQRIDLEPRLYFTQQDKFFYLIQIIQQCWNTNRPVLIGTTSVNESEIILGVLQNWTHPRYAQQRSRIQLLNAKPENVRTEAQIIAQAGLPGMVTIATNMAGRGTDIVLGGYPQGLTKLGLMRLVYWRQFADDRDRQAVPAMPLPIFSHYEHHDFFQIPTQNAPPSSGGFALPRSLHLALFQAIAVAEAGALSGAGASSNGTNKPTAEGAGPGGRVLTYEQAREMASWAMDKAEKIRREVVSRVKTIYTQTPVEELEYTVCLTPVIEEVLQDKETEWGLLSEGPAQRFAIAAAVYLWLWFDKQCAIFSDQVKAAGGLLVVGTSLQEGKRIELQLRGRAGRQGDPGQTLMMYDLTDPLVQVYGMGMIQRMWEQLQSDNASNGASDAYLDGPLVKLVVHDVQKRLENQWQMMRLDTQKYDVIMEDYRANFYMLRRLILKGSSSQRAQLIYMFVQSWVDRKVSQYLDPAKGPQHWCKEHLEPPTTSALGAATFAPGCKVSPLALLMWHLNQLVNPDGVTSKLDVEFKTVQDGEVKDNTMQTLLKLLGYTPSGEGGDAIPPGAIPRMPLNIVEVQVMSAEQVRDLAEFLLDASGQRSLELPTPPFRVSVKFLTALLTHRQLLSGQQTAGWGGVQGQGAFERPQLNGRYADKVAIVRDYLGEALIYAYEMRKLGMKKLLQGGQVRMMDLDADVQLATHEQYVMLQWMDALWSSFLEDVDRLKKAVSVKSFGNFAPLQEFRIEANRVFLRLLDTFRDAVVEKVFTPNFSVNMYMASGESPVASISDVMGSRDEGDKPTTRGGAAPQMSDPAGSDGNGVGSLQPSLVLAGGDAVYLADESQTSTDGSSSVPRKGPDEGAGGAEEAGKTSQGT